MLLAGVLRFERHLSPYLLPPVTIVHPQCHCEACPASRGNPPAGTSDIFPATFYRKSSIITTGRVHLSRKSRHCRWYSYTKKCSGGYHLPATDNLAQKLVGANCVRPHCLRPIYTERVAAVDKIQDMRKPEDLIGYRNRT